MCQSGGFGKNVGFADEKLSLVHQTLLWRCKAQHFIQIR